MIALRKHCLFYGINRDVLFNERSGLQIGGALLYALELGTAFFVTFQFHVVAEDTDLVRFFEYIRESEPHTPLFRLLIIIEKEI